MTTTIKVIKLKQREIMTHIAYKRKQMGYSQAAFAELTGIGISTIKRFETEGNINLETYLTMCHYLNIEV